MSLSQIISIFADNYKGSGFQIISVDYIIPNDKI